MIMINHNYNDKTKITITNLNYNKKIYQLKIFILLSFSLILIYLLQYLIICNVYIKVFKMFKFFLLDGSIKKLNDVI